MPKESKLELKVGLFVLAALIGFTFIIWSISDSSVFEKGKTLKVIFGFANGLKKAAPVRIAGVDQGLVRAITLFFDREDGHTKALVELWVKKDALIPSDSSVMINQLGFLGEKYVEVIPGVDTKNYFQDGQTVVGKDPIAQEILSEKIMQVAGKMDGVAGGLSKIISDEKNQQAISNTLQNISDITFSVKESKGTIGRLFYDAHLYEDLEALTADLKANPWKLLYRPKGN